MTSISRAMLGALALFLGCGHDNNPTSTTATSTCVVANALMGTGSQSIIGTKTVTAIYDSSGQSITSDPSKRVVVGQSAPPVSGWQLAGAVVGPNAGFCTAPIKITTQIGESTGPANYTVDATAVWPATTTQ